MPTTADINYIEDKNGDVFFPVTHVGAVIDDDNNALNSILDDKVSSSSYDNIVSMSKTDFDALATKDGRTMYIVDDPNGGGSPVISALLSKTTYASTDTSVSSLAWDTMHVFPEMASLTLSSFATAPSDSYEHEMAIVFDTPSSVSSFSLGVPSSLLWANNIDLAQNISASTRYEVRISSSSMIAVYTETALS